MSKKLPKNAQKDYEEFVVEIDYMMEDLQELLDASETYRHVNVGFDDESLNSIERFFVDAVDGKENVDVTRARLERIFTAYVGEAVIGRAGGHWALNTVEDDPSFGTPVIIEWAREAMRISPVELRESLLENREPLLRDLVEYCVNKDTIEEDFFKEFR